MKISEFFKTQYIDYAVYDSYRSIANFTDGLKPSARKVINSIRKRKNNNKEKVSIFVSDCSRENEYLHGSTSLEGVVVGLAQDFAGANNINVLLPEGSFGSRTIQSAAASRYIFTRKNPILDNIIIDADSSILIEQEFEGTKIEPRFYIPIIPMLLVNGSEGIGNGFAQKILSRDPKVLIDAIIKKLNTSKSPSNIPVFYKNFKGQINRIENNSWEILGCFERTNQTTITVTELPIGYDLEKYLSILNRLEEDKVISDYIDKSEENKFIFEIKTSREFIKKDDRWILEKLKLIKRLTENFTCIGSNNEILEFQNEVEIFNSFFDLRLEYYDKRKTFLLNKLKKELSYLGAKYYFVKGILDDKITVFKQSKETIEKQIISNNDYNFKQFDNLNFLLNMPIHSFTKETFSELKDQIVKKRQEIKIIQETEIKDMWIAELETLKNKLKG